VTLLIFYFDLHLLIVVITIKTVPEKTFFGWGKIKHGKLGHLANFGLEQTFLWHVSTELAEILYTYSLTEYLGEF